MKNIGLISSVDDILVQSDIALDILKGIEFNIRCKKSKKKNNLLSPITQIEIPEN
jgi:hypothetical protein